jgi:hypothetical protein
VLDVAHEYLITHLPIRGDEVQQTDRGVVGLDLAE